MTTKKTTRNGESEKTVRTRKPGKKPAGRRDILRGLWWKLPLLAIICAVVAGAAFFYANYKDMEKRFASRMWSIPSTVFSDSPLLFPGQKLTRNDVRALLEERNYRRANGGSLGAGEYRWGADRIRVSLRKFHHPGRELPAQEVELRFANGVLTSIEGPEGSLGLLELEPLEITRLHGEAKESRFLIDITQATPFLPEAVVAIEDHRFYEHPGVDVHGIIRALIHDVRTGSVAQGGSTITQQLVKNYFLTPEKTIRRKLTEAGMSLVLESLFTKQQILEMYLNEIYMGQDGAVAIHGMGEAARYYFGRNVEDLSLNEAAALAGMIQAPNRYSPFRNLAACEERTRVVLDRMVEEGNITEDQADEAAGAPLRPRNRVLPTRLAPYYVDYVLQQLRELYDPEVLESEGLTIYTSLNATMALAADEAVKEGLAELEKTHKNIADQANTRKLQAVLVTLRPKTGAVVALVGGRDFVDAPYNRAVRSLRQPGSAFKPFVYLTALDQFNPASRLEDEPVTIRVGGEDWSPHNYDHRFRGEVSFRDALEQSLNIPTVHLAQMTGLDKIIETARRFGIKTPMDPYPSLALGAFEVAPIDLAEAYAALANEGQKPFLLSLKEVYDPKGEVLQRRNVGFETVTSAAKAYIITNILQGAVVRGTGRALAGLGIDFHCAGKTGTTSDYRDSWFVGYTSDLLTLVWVGYDDNSETGLSGSSGALRIWARYMNKIRPWFNPRPFHIPPGVMERAICLDTGNLAGYSGYCANPRREYFLPEHLQGY